MTEWTEWKAEQAAVWLRHLRDMKHDIDRLHDEIEVQRSLALPKGVDYSRPVVAASPRADAIPDAVARLEDSIAGYVSELDAYIGEKGEARDCLMLLDDSRHRAVLILYYLNGHSWEGVGERMGYDPNYCRELRNDALPFVYDVMPREWKTMIPRAD